MRQLVLIAVLIACSAAPAAAQFQMPSFGQSGTGQPGSGLAGILGGALPNIGATGAGNAAGVLDYCVRNQLLGSGSGAISALQALTGRKGLISSPGYAAGQQGTLVTGRNQSFSLGDVKGRIKTKVCGMVLQHARALL